MRLAHAEIKGLRLDPKIIERAPAVSLKSCETACLENASRFPPRISRPSRKNLKPPPPYQKRPLFSPRSKRKGKTNKRASKPNQNIPQNNHKQKKAIQRNHERVKSEGGRASTCPAIPGHASSSNQLRPPAAPAPGGGGGGGGGERRRQDFWWGG